jgi:hypothetical protein
MCLARDEIQLGLILYNGGWSDPLHISGTVMDEYGT